MADEKSTDTRTCSTCSRTLPSNAFSQKQWRNSQHGTGRCLGCVGDGSRKDRRIQTPKFPDMAPRPQRTVPGFAYDPPLTVCSDWPQTKKGSPPNAQSAIFGPLICCALGPIEGHCSAGELEVAIEWWTRAFPAWRRWIQELRAAGIVDRKDALIFSAKGQPNPLIFKCRGWGTENKNPTSPHFRGREQNHALEMAPAVEVEVMACTMVLYTAAQQEELEKEGKVG